MLAMPLPSYLAAALPGLEHLTLRSPKANLGRISHRSGQSSEGIAFTCCSFCAVDALRLRNVWQLLPKLRSLMVMKFDDLPNDIVPLTFPLVWVRGYGKD